MNDPLHQDLTHFRQTVTWKQMSFANHTWDYVIGGQGDAWLLLLHGGGGNSEMLFHYFMRLSPYFKLIAPSMPSAIDNMRQITDGLAALFDHDGIDKAHVFGPSLGGMVAQVFACSHPDRVAKCVFSHTGLPQPEQAAVLNKALLPLKIIPYGLFRWQTLRSIRTQLKSDIPDITQEETDFWLSRLTEMYQTRLSKVDVIASVRLQIDYHERIDLSSCSIRNHAGRVMLIFHENDAAFGAAEQSTMRDFYPQAAFHQLPVYGHLGALVRSEDIIQHLKDFLNNTHLYGGND